MDKVVLIENFGGLGDNLQFSTLPEEFKLQKNLDFYVHNSTFENIRNKEIFQLVWEMNPYFKGVSNESPNAGRVHRYPTKENMVCDIESLHGLECKNDTFKLYYEPKKIGEINTLFDLTSTSLYDEYFKNYENFKKIVTDIVENNNSEIYFVYFNNLNSEKYRPIYDIPNSKKIEVNSIFEYCDVISSCQNFVGLQSGGSHLAKTYQKKYNYNITLIEPSWFDGWRFQDINYIKIN
jgi:hypothetical protein